MALSKDFDPDSFLQEASSFLSSRQPSPVEDEEEEPPFDPDQFLTEVKQLNTPKSPASPDAELGKVRYSAELPELNDARELRSLEKTLANYADQIGAAGQGAIWEENLGKQESDIIRSVIGDVKYSGKDDTNFAQRLLGARPIEESQVSDLIAQSKAVTRDGPIADSPVFAALERYKQLKQTVSPDQLKDSEAVNWKNNTRPYAELSNGSIILRPEAFNSKEAFDGAVNTARKEGALDDREVSSLMAKWPEIEAGFNEAGLKAALPTQDFKNFKDLEENAGLSDEEVFKKYKTSQTWVDKLQYSGGVFAKSAVDSILYPVLGATVPTLNKLGEETGIDSLKQAGQSLSEFAVEAMLKPSYSDDTRGGFGGGVDSALQAFGQGAGQVVQALAMRRIFGSKLAGTSTVMLSGSLQTGLEGYLGVYESAIASGKTHEQANEEATRAFVANMPAGLLEAVPIDRVLSKIPRGLVGKAAKAIGSGLSEVATENIQNYANNLVNQAVSSTYMEQQGMGLEENVGMFAGMTALDVITGSVRGRISRSSFSRTMRPDSTVLAPEERSERNKLVDYIATDLSQSIDEYRKAYGDDISQDNIRKLFANAPGMANPNVADPAIDAFERILKADKKSKAEKDLRTAAEKAASAESPLVAEALNKAADKAKTEADDLLTSREILDELESKDGMDDTDEDGAPAGDDNVSGAPGIISGDTTSTEARTEEQAAQPNPRDAEADNVTTPAPTVTTPTPARPLPTDALPTETPGATYGRETEVYDVFADTRRRPMAAELAPEVSPQQQTTTTPTPTNEGGEFNEEGQLRMRGQEGQGQGQGRGPEGLTPTPTDSGAGAEGDLATPPPIEAPAPLSETPVAEQQTAKPQPTEQQGNRVTTATGAKGVISKKPLPVEEVQTGTDEQGRPITRVVPRFVNDSNTLAESLHQNGGAERIYIPDEVIDDEQIDDDNIGFAFEKGTGRAYVTWARHLRYPDSPVMGNGRTEDNATLEQLYQNDPKRQERSEAQTKGEGVKLTENSQEFSDKLAEAPMSELERNEPQTVQRELASIQRLAAELSEETVTTNSGEVATIGPALADEIASAATNLYLARLRGVVSGEFADAAGVVRDVKAKAVRALRSRGAGNAAVSLDQQIGDGTNTRGDVVEDTNAQEPGMTQAELDEQESQAPAEAQIEQERTQPQDVSEALQFALDMAVMDLSDADRATWLEYKKRTTENREGGKGAYRLTNEQKRVAELVRQKANDMLVEDLAQERDVDDATGALKPPKPQILTEAEQAQMDQLNKRVDEREAQRLDDRVRRNTREVLAMAKGGEGGRIDIRTILQTLANDKKQSALVRYFANWLAKSPHDFGNVKLQLIANRNKRANWAGLYKAGSKASSGTIQINTASEHRGGIGQTILHEALHHIVLYKIRPSYKRNAVEKAAYRDLMKILTHARRQLLMPEQGETLSQTARREFGSDDTFYGLTNLDELFTETLTNERFFAWLNSQDAIPGLQTKGTFRTLWNQLKQAFHNFVYGVQVRPDSLLAQSLDNIMALSRDPQSDRKIREYNNTVAERQSARQQKFLDEVNAEISAASVPKAVLNAAAVQNPLGFEFKTQQAIRGMLNPNKRGELKGLTAAPDGTVPWENLRAKITKAFSAEEADLVLPALESMVSRGRVNVAAAGEALQTIADASARVTVLNAGQEAAPLGKEIARINHQLDSLYAEQEKFAVGQDEETGEILYDLTSPEFLTLNRNINKLEDERDDLIEEQENRAFGIAPESATARYTMVNPKPLEDMPDAGDILVEEPLQGENSFERAQRVKFSEDTHFPTRKNVIGFGRKYTETLPNGEEATFVFEVQSDWASTERDYTGVPSSPLLPVYENLVLKAAIQDALAKGHTKLIITDAETAMMTEGRDRSASPAAWYVVNGEYATYRDSKEAAEKEVAQLRAAPIEDGGNPNARLEYREAGRPTQEPGMRAAYDPATGRLHNIMRKLTGDRGVRVDLGVHQNAVTQDIPRQQIFSENVTDLTDAQISVRLEELRQQHPDWENLTRADTSRGVEITATLPVKGGKVVGSPVFKNPDGTPKTNITGIAYDLTPILENQEKVRALFAAPVNPSATPNPRAAKVDMMVQEEIPALGGTTVRSANLNGHPAQARFNENGQPEIVYDPLAIATEVEGLDDSEARTVIRKLLGHEQAHVAGLINDYGTADAQGRTGREKIEAFHDEVMTPEMRQDVADSYVRRLDGMTDEDYAQAKAEFLADKAAVVGEFKRMFLERHLTGESYEDSLAALERKTGNKFGDLVRAIADYIVGRIRMLQTRFEMTKDPRLAAEILADRRMLENLNTGTNGLVGDRVAGVQEGTPLNASRAQIRRMKKNSAGWKASGWFGQGLMDMRVFKRETQRDSEIRAANYRVTETARRFNRQVKQSGVNAQVLQDALGTTENRLTDSQYDQFKTMQRAAKRETDPVKREAAQQAADQFRIAQVRTNNQTNRAKRQAALAQLPADLRDTVLEMRKHIDGFTKTIVSKGMVGSDLQATLGDNLEVYLNRSYEIFDNPEWSEFILTDQSPESIVIRNDAQRLFRSQLVAEEARRIRRNAKMANQPVPTRQQALAAAQATVTQNDVDTMMQDYLRKGDSPSVAILGGRVPGKKDMSIMKLRGQIPKEIRALWGEYKDPEVNYARTYMNMARFVAEHSFQQDFLDMGLNSPTPFLWKEGVSTTPKPPHWVPVYPGLSDSPNPNPMAGVYGPEIIGQAFKDMDVQIKHPMVNEWLMGLTGFSMAAKTVYNVPQSNVRNFLGNGLLMFAQGYLGADITKLGFLNRIATSAKVTGPQAIGLRPERNAAVTDYVERLIGLGVMGDNVKANVVKELTSVVFDRNPAKAFGEKAAMAWKFVKGANERVTDAYQAADDFWKIVAFESERSLMERAYPNATPESLDRMAADRVRDVVPTYSMIPKIVQDLVKKQPYFAPFISWTSEIIRTTANTYRIGWQDATSGNPALQASGIWRLGLATTAFVILGAVASTVREMMGIPEEDEERLRRFLPEWQVNALLMVTGKKEDGKISFWDLSYLNPYNVLQEPFIAVSRELASGSGLLSAAAAGAQKLLDPWTGEQLLFGAIMDVSRGVTVDGNPLYEKADTEWNKTKARLNRIASALTPGSINISNRIYKAFTGTIERSGRSYDLSNELIGPIIGQRLTENDPMQSFQIGKIPKFKGMMQSAANLATREFRTRGTPDLTKIRENYVQSNDARMKAFSEIKKDVDALIGLGVPESKVWGALAAAELSKDDLRQIQAGIYVQRTPSNDTLDNAVGTPDYQKKLQAMREAIAGYPETQTLIDPE